MQAQQINGYHGKLAVFCDNLGDISAHTSLAEALGVPLRQTTDIGQGPERFWLTWRDGCVKLLDQELLKKGGLYVEVEPRQGEQRSWPAPKDGALAKALGRKTKTVVDATTGWGQDSLHIFRMGYEVTCIERSALMAALLADGFRRLRQLDWVQRLQLMPPTLLTGNAITLLAQLPSAPDCIYLDPMFPPKRKKSALAKKAMMVLQDLLGDDADKSQLFAAAIQAKAKRVVVKSPDYAEPLGGKPQESFQGKLLRYDVYLR
ncbi:MAG: class I SAM-dependent methyltransferase [Methylococcaceae bacterium]|jgi:16S rRNA (guanine1516-N2)-methyltransferase